MHENVLSPIYVHLVAGVGTAPTEVRDMNPISHFCFMPAIIFIISNERMCAQIQGAELFLEEEMVVL
jgi:hypothetical protein